MEKSDLDLMTKRLFLLLVVGAIHGVALYILASSLAGVTTPRPTTPVLVAILIQPRIQDAGDVPAGPDLSRLLARLETPPKALDIELPEIDVVVARNEAAASAAPSPKEAGHTNMGPYIRQAALLPGEGATVVLRIEVLATGEPGRIEIDTSSGSAQIDQAAVDYARTRRWYAGWMNGAPHAMWIRWGVRLQA